MLRRFLFTSLLLIGLAIPCFALNSPLPIQGKDLLSGQELAIKTGTKGTVVIFMSAECPCSDSHKAIVKKLSENFKNFTFVAVHSNTNESLESSKKYFEMAKFPFPVLQDDHSKLADALKAFKTPHAFLISPDGKILYQGGVTNSNSGPNADQQFLQDALNDVQAGKEVRVAHGRTLGCVISRGEQNVW